MNAPIKCLHTEVWPIERVQPNPLNPNRHNEGQVILLAHILKESGWRNPIVVSKRSNLVIKGHGRLAAAIHAGITEVPIELQDYANEAEEMADMIADNRLSELSEMDQVSLHSVLAELREDPEFNLGIAGFTDEALSDLNAYIEENETIPEDGVQVNPETSTPSTELSDTTFKLANLRFSIPRDDYLKWQEELRKKVGFTPQAAVSEIRRRLSL